MQKIKAFDISFKASLLDNWGLPWFTKSLDSTQCYLWCQSYRILFWKFRACVEIYVEIPNDPKDGDFVPVVFRPFDFFVRSKR